MKKFELIRWFSPRETTAVPLFAFSPPLQLLKYILGPQNILFLKYERIEPSYDFLIMPFGLIDLCLFNLHQLPKCIDFLYWFSEIIGLGEWLSLRSTFLFIFL